MIPAEAFIQPAKILGYTWYAGVPCSYMKSLINCVIIDDDLDYVSCANEGDAVAFACGVTLGGLGGVALMQNSGLGNAINPMTSLSHVYQIPILLIISLRGDPEFEDEPQHRLMGNITPQLLETMGIPWSWFPEEPELIESELSTAMDRITRDELSYAFLMKKNSVIPFPPGSQSTKFYAPPESGVPVRGNFDPQTRTEILHAVDEVVKTEPRTVVIASTGYTGRELYHIADRPAYFYMVGSMGCATSLALGLAMARPDLRVLCIDGDGAALMRMGNMATIGGYRPANLHHLLLDNGVHDSTGGQKTVSASMNFGAVAAACGYTNCIASNEPGEIATWLQEKQKGPTFLHCRIRPGAPADLPRPRLTPPEIRARFMDTIGAKGLHRNSG